MADRGQLQAQWIPIATKFPPTLNRSSAPDALSDGQTPDAYGVGLERPGWLYADSSPTPGARLSCISAGLLTPTGSPFTNAGAVWYCIFGRIWGFFPACPVATEKAWLVYGAPGNDTNVLILQSNGILEARVTAENTTPKPIMAIAPRGTDLDVWKESYLFTVPGAAGSAAPGDIVHVADIGTANADTVTSLDGVSYFANTSGIYAYNGERVEEVSAAVRSSVAPFESGSIDSLYISQQKHRVMGVKDGAVKFAIDSAGPALYDYSQNGFRYTTPTFLGEAGETLMIDAVALLYSFSGGGKQNITFDVKINDEWISEPAMKFDPAVENGRVEIPLVAARSCRKWAMRLTGIPAEFYISRILARVRQGGIRGYSGA